MTKFSGTIKEIAAWKTGKNQWDHYCSTNLSILGIL